MQQPLTMYSCLVSLTKFIRMHEGVLWWTSRFMVFIFNMADIDIDVQDSQPSTLIEVDEIGLLTEVDETDQQIPQLTTPLSLINTDEDAQEMELRVLWNGEDVNVGCKCECEWMLDTWISECRMDVNAFMDGYIYGYMDVGYMDKMCDHR